MSADESGQGVAGAAGRRRPPALGRWLLRWSLPRSLVAETIAGDLEQEFRARPARVRYLRQAAQIAFRSTLDRIRGRSWFRGVAAGSGGAPAGRSAPSVPPSSTGPGGPPRRALPGDTFLQDLRFAARMLVQRPLFAVVAIGTLAIGMGINTAIFSVANGLLFRPVPAIEAPEELVDVARRVDGGYTDVSWAGYRMLRDNTSTLQGLAAWDGITLAYRDAGEEEARAYSGREVTGNYFSVLGVEPALGRFFNPDSLWPDVAAEIVITHHVWQERYGGSPDVVGREVSINGYPTSIIGVAPERFGGHEVIVQRDVFVPIGLPAPGMLSAGDLESVRNGFLVLIGRRAEGAALQRVREEVAALGERFAEEHGIDEDYGLRADAYTGIPATDHGMVAMFFGLLLLTSSMVMAIACVNVANMLLSRSLERRRELTIRMALGAGRGRLARQLLTEATLLFVVAAGLAVLLSAWATDLLVRGFLPRMTSTRLLLDVSPDLRVLGFAFGGALLTGIVFGLAPALVATRAARVSARGAGSPLRTARLRGALVAAQMALALVLLVSAGLITRTLSALEAIDLGFDLDGVFSVELDVDHAGYDVERARVFYAELLDRVRAVPGVVAAATARKLPMGSESWIVGVHPQGVDAPPEEGYRVAFNRVSDAYFRTSGIALLDGREFRPADDENAPAVAIVNASMARRMWGERDVVGRRFTAGRGASGRSYEIVGVAADATYHQFVEETPNFVYLASAQSPDTLGHLLIRGDLEATLGAVRQTISALDPDVPVVEVTTMRTNVEGFSMGQRLAAWISGVVGLVGLVLGAVGVYGVTAFSIGQRRREIGVRMALGARAGDVRRMMLRRGMRAPLIGIVAGLLLAALAAQLIGSFLYGVSTLDPWTYGVVIVVLGGVALLATLVPAHRAAGLDPVRTLRSE